MDPRLPIRSLDYTVIFARPMPVMREFSGVECPEEQQAGLFPPALDRPVGNTLHRRHFGQAEAAEELQVVGLRPPSGAPKQPSRVEGGTAYCYRRSSSLKSNSFHPPQARVQPPVFQR